MQWFEAGFAEFADFRLRGIGFPAHWAANFIHSVNPRTVDPQPSKRAGRW